MARMTAVITAAQNTTITPPNIVQPAQPQPCPHIQPSYIIAILLRTAGNRRRHQPALEAAALVGSKVTTLGGYMSLRVRGPGRSQRYSLAKSRPRMVPVHLPSRNETVRHGHGVGLDSRAGRRICQRWRCAGAAAAEPGSVQ